MSNCESKEVVLAAEYWANWDWKQGDKNNTYPEGSANWKEYERRWHELEIEYEFC